MKNFDAIPRPPLALSFTVAAIAVAQALNCSQDKQKTTPAVKTEQRAPEPLCIDTEVYPVDHDEYRARPILKGSFLHPGHVRTFLIRGDRATGPSQLRPGPGFTFSLSEVDHAPAYITMSDYQAAPPTVNKDGSLPVTAQAVDCPPTDLRQKALDAISPHQ